MLYAGGRSHFFHAHSANKARAARSDALNFFSGHFNRRAHRPPVAGRQRYRRRAVISHHRLPIDIVGDLALFRFG
jgi:hypothetical protein